MLAGKGPRQSVRPAEPERPSRSDKRRRNPDAGRDGRRYRRGSPVGAGPTRGRTATDRCSSSSTDPAEQHRGSPRREVGFRGVSATPLRVPLLELPSERRPRCSVGRERRPRPSADPATPPPTPGTDTGFTSLVTTGVAAYDSLARSPAGQPPTPTPTCSGRSHPIANPSPGLAPLTSRSLRPESRADPLLLGFDPSEEAVTRVAHPHGYQPGAYYRSRSLRAAGVLAGRDPRTHTVGCSYVKRSRPENVLWTVSDPDIAEES